MVSVWRSRRAPRNTASRAGLRWGAMSGILRAGGGLPSTVVGRAGICMVSTRHGIARCERWGSRT
eukprot:5813357-Lingulodinium_polyedra.AAC.1